MGVDVSCAIFFSIARQFAEVGVASASVDTCLCFLIVVHLGRALSSETSSHLNWDVDKSRNQKSSEYPSGTREFRAITNLSCPVSTRDADNSTVTESSRL
jgi:hypothetical protein